MPKNIYDVIEEMLDEEVRGEDMVMVDTMNYKPVEVLS